MQHRKSDLPRKIRCEKTCFLEADIAKLFKQNRQLAAIAAPDAKIIFHEAPFVQYEQFRVNNNFRQYLETIMISKKVLQLPVKNTFEKVVQMAIGTGGQNLMAEFTAPNRQFD